MKCFIRLYHDVTLLTLCSILLLRMFHLRKHMFALQFFPSLNIYLIYLLWFCFSHFALQYIKYRLYKSEYVRANLMCEFMHVSMFMFILSHHHWKGVSTIRLTRISMRVFGVHSCSYNNKAATILWLRCVIKLNF